MINLFMFATFQGVKGSHDEAQERQETRDFDTPSFFHCPLHRRDDGTPNYRPLEKATREQGKRPDRTRWDPLW